MRPEFVSAVRRHIIDERAAVEQLPGATHHRAWLARVRGPGRHSTNAVAQHPACQTAARTRRRSRPPPVAHRFCRTRTLRRDPNPAQYKPRCGLLSSVLVWSTLGAPPPYRDRSHRPAAETSDCAFGHGYAFLLKRFMARQHHGTGRHVPMARNGTLCSCLPEQRACVFPARAFISRPLPSSNWVNIVP